MNYEGWSEYLGRLLTVLKWQLCRLFGNSFWHCMARLTQPIEVFHTADMFDLLSHCEMDVLQSKIFALNLIKWPQKCTRYYNSHFGQRELNQFKTFEWYSLFAMVALLVKNQDSADRFCWFWGFGSSWICCQGPQHESECLQNSSATPSRCTSSETTSQMVSSTWRFRLSNALCPASLSARVFDQVVVCLLPFQIWPSVTSSRFPGWRSPWKGKYFKKSQRCYWIQHGSCRPFWNRSTTDALKSGRISGICVQPIGAYSGENNSG